MKTFFILVVAMMLMVVSSAPAQDDAVGTAGAQFLRVPVSARQVAMGGAALANVQGADALYWNPAQAALLDDRSLSFTHLDYFADMSLDYFAFTIPIESLGGTVGLNLNMFSVGDIEVTTENAPEGTGATINPYDVALGLTYARAMTDRVAFGLTFKYIHEAIGDVSASGMAVDIGFSYKTGIQGLTLAVLMNNFGPNMKFEGSGLGRNQLLDSYNPNADASDIRFEAAPFELPSSIKFGVSYDVLSYEAMKLTVNADEVVENFASDKTCFGVEFSYNDLVFLRGGYGHQNEVGFELDDVGGPAFGGGLKKDLGGFTLFADYAYADMGILQEVHRFSFSITF